MSCRTNTNVRAGIKTTAQRITVGVLAVLLMSSPMASADVVLDWNAIMVNTVGGQNPFAQARFAAITQVAVFEAVNTITGDYDPYLGTITAPPGASAEAAAVAAAHGVLRNYFPDSATSLDAARASSLAAIADGQAKDDGIAVGEAAAAALIADRAGDGSAPPQFYVPPSANPGEWQTTPGCPAAGGILLQWRNVMPFGIQSSDQFRSEPPPALTSDQYTTDYNEVLQVGALNSTARPQDRTDVARYFAVAVPAHLWNQAARQVSVAQSKSLSENARIFALLNMAISDGLVSVMETKYHYVLWRPITAIRAGDTDGNPSTDPDPAWAPFITTPCFPSYPSAHAAGSYAARTIVETIFGSGDHDFTLSNPGIPDVTLHYTKFSQVTDDIDDARVYGGIHFRFDQEAGAHLGASVGSYVYENNLRSNQVATTVGDCDGGGSVTVDELITLVTIALNNAQPSACPHGVPSGAHVDIALIIQAVNNALNGCGGGVECHADIMTVTNTLDEGAGSLRDTIAKAKGGDTIVFSPNLAGQTITLTSDQLTINQSLDIKGPGARRLTISGNDKNRVFEITEAATVTISGLTIAHGRFDANAVDGGGAILNRGNLTLANDIVSDNTAIVQGGAIANRPNNIGAPPATMTVMDSTFLHNTCTGGPLRFAEGGAIWNDDEGSTVTITRSAFIDNLSFGGDGGDLGDLFLLGESNGGALHNGYASKLTVEDSTFIGNQSIGGSGGNGSGFEGLVGVAIGGAISNDDGGNLAVNNCTFEDNEAIGGNNNRGSTIADGVGYVGTARGGAIYQGGAGTITNCMFVANEARGGNGNTGSVDNVLVGVGMGGAIDNNYFGHPATLTVGNCTLTNNKAVGGARNVAPGAFVGAGIGGVLENSQGAAAAITNCTLRGNEAVGGAGGSGGNGGDALGGGVANFLGSSLTVSNCRLTGNETVGGVLGAGGSGGNGFGGGVFNGGTSTFPENAAIPPTLRLLASTITGNTANGGAGGGSGVGGGAYFKADGAACLNMSTSISANTASTSDNNIFGVFTTCP